MGDGPVKPNLDDLIEFKWQVNKFEFCKPHIPVVIEGMAHVGPGPCEVMDVKIDKNKMVQVLNESLINPLTTHIQTGFDIGYAVGAKKVVVVKR